MSSKIVLIDGHSILNRAFYGLPDLTNAEGLHTNAIYGFLTIMFKLLEEEKPEYLTVAFDVHAPTFRHKMYAEYKGTRKPMADELRQQVPVIKEVLHAMGVKTIECAGLEADDLIGTLSNRCENADYGAAEQYLTFEHDEFTMKPTLDENGRLIPREDYRISSLNCEGEDFAVACMRANLRYEKNQKREDVKSHHYIISFDPRDAADNGLTVDRDRKSVV